MRSHRFPAQWCAALFLPLVAAAELPGVSPPAADYVIHVSVDGLRPDAIQLLGVAGAPNFNRLKSGGAWTENARTDYDYSITLPNHTCQLTGRPVVGAAGHAWTTNTDPAAGVTLHTNKGSYVAGAFDIAHDAGRRTGLFASKTKFSLYSSSWDAINGALDVTGADNGRNKVDVYRNLADTNALVDELLIQESAAPMAYAFLHLADTDNAGHSCGWDPAVGSCYSNAVKKVDGLLGRLLDFIGLDPRFTGRTTIIVTADHGGTGTDHSNATLAVNYTIPFYVWGSGCTPGADLFQMNPVTRKNPGAGRPLFVSTPPPIRNGDAANLATRLLGLSSVTGSSIGNGGDLATALPVPSPVTVTLVGTTATVSFPSQNGFRYDVQSSEQLPVLTWSNVATNIAGTGSTVTQSETVLAATRVKFYRVVVHP